MMKSTWFKIFLITLLAILLCLLALRGAALAQEQQDIIGKEQTYKVKRKDTLYDIARLYDLGTVELFAANPGIDRWQPKPGTKLTLPTAFILPPPPHEGLMINLAESRLYYFSADGTDISSFPISSGKPCCKTPTGKTHIAKKRINPSWTVPKSIREKRPELPEIVPPGPDNPLGSFALNLGWKNFVIHGTNKPWAIGRSVSHGCIRMYPEDIAQLFPLVEEGMSVRIIYDPVSLGWQDSELYLDVHPDPAQVETEVAPPIADTSSLYTRIEKIAGEQSNRLDWYAIEQAMGRRSGTPLRITLPDQ